MGVDLEHFVEPDRISRQLICAICSCVLHKPVETQCEHLFCEAELLEWMTHNSRCPLDNCELDPALIKKPSRIIINMLGELRRYCPNKEHGCPWVGEADNLGAHTKVCEHVPREELYERLRQRDKKITYLVKVLKGKDARVTELEAKFKAQAERLTAACVALAEAGVAGGGDDDDDDGDDDDDDDDDDGDSADAGAAAGGGGSPTRALDASSADATPQRRGPWRAWSPGDTPGDGGKASEHSLYEDDDDEGECEDRLFAAVRTGKGAATGGAGLPARRSDAGAGAGHGGRA